MGNRANNQRDRERECVRERAYERKGWCGYKDLDILINSKLKHHMIIMVNDVRKVNISIREIVTKVFLIRDIYNLTTKLQIYDTSSDYNSSARMTFITTQSNETSWGGGTGTLAPLKLFERPNWMLSLSPLSSST